MSVRSVRTLLVECETEADDAAGQTAYQQLPAEPAERMLATMTTDDRPGIVGEVILTADHPTEPPR